LEDNYKQLNFNTGMNFDYHAVASAATAAIPLAAGAAGVGYFILRQKGFGFGTSHLLVGLPMFAVGGAAAAFFLITK
tara:strand:+ start:164 stop:394 length:231 start_codon:yes stop_codon:yes gene_type:complete